MSDRLAGRLGVSPDTIFDEQWNIRRSLAKWWNDKRNNIESVEKIPAEGSGSNGSRKICICGCYESDVY
jgi:hypothetical protein